MAENTLLEKVLSLQDKYKKLEESLADPAVIADMKKFVQLNKDYKELQPIIEAGLEYKRMLDELAQAKDILMNEKDEDLKDMAREEISEIEPKLPDMEQNIKLLLIPADPDDSKNAMVEIRGGTGGDEAAIFAGDLFRMYQHYAERRGWKLEVTDQAPGTAGGFKQIVFKLSSSQDGVYGVMKYESGVHRVQRVPQTETQGRIQTSAASVAVFPEAGEFDVELNPADIRKDLFCASGPGGQGVNTTYSAVRLTHIPSGLVVQCQEERSQLKNLDRAMEELRTRLYNLEHQKYLDGIAAKRKTMVSTGDRSAKIRTYGPPHRLEHVQPARLHGRRHPGMHRPAPDRGERRTAQGSRRGGSIIWHAIPKPSRAWAIRRPTVRTMRPKCWKPSRTSIPATTTGSVSTARSSPPCAPSPASPTSPKSASATCPTSGWWSPRASSSICSASAATAISTRTS